ncbi:ATP-binding response regulator [Anaerophilus nitritogenes]|uniref:ATP-binding response regulator n=1 Tax=Anaerophilus nitritogenes TaxID=2498136 RepID=UPI00101DD76D|nr:ATP-binding protein [Anaerophilus nitritogenes]
MTNNMKQSIYLLERKNKEDILSTEKKENVFHIKTQFLLNVSHEIRTPMNAIIGFAQMLGNSPLNEEQREYVEIIKSSGQSLLKVIDDIVDISKIQQGKLNLEETYFHMIELIEATIKSFSIEARRKGIEIGLFIQSKIPYIVKGDPIRLKQVIHNLMSNAVKFTEQGEVYIDVRLGEEIEDKVYIEFKIEDTGIGISNEVMDRLFEPFAQEDESFTRRFGGNGLGLFICKELVKMMNGRIKVESTEGKGSKFECSIPFYKYMDEDMPDCKEYVSLKDKRVLIVDSHPRNCEIVKAYLEEAGCIVEKAYDITEALNKLISNNDIHCVYDIVLMDDQIASMHEYNVLSVLKALSFTKNIQIILASYIPVEENIKNEFSGYVSKPYKRSELLETFENTINTISK